MREIKFKAKTCNGKWVEGLLAHKDDKWYISNKVGQPFAFEVRPETICQYTGLKDKNGKEMYESDILEWQVRNGSSDYYECVWLEDECSFAFNSIRDRNNYENPVDCYDYYDTCEFCMGVIGNIFDNPDLLDLLESEV